jgi:hypothetical protein
MSMESDYSTLAGPLNQLGAVLADAAQLLMAIKLTVAEQTNATLNEADAEHRKDLMRLKDDGCPHGE